MWLLCSRCVLRAVTNALLCFWVAFNFYIYIYTHITGNEYRGAEDFRCGRFWPLQLLPISRAIQLARGDSGHVRVLVSAIRFPPFHTITMNGVLHL